MTAADVLASLRADLTEARQTLERKYQVAIDSGREQVADYLAGKVAGVDLSLGFLTDAEKLLGSAS